MRKLDDETKAGIISIVWVMSFCIASLVNISTMWLIFSFITILEAVIVYFDHKREQERKRADKNHELFVRQCENYTDYVESQK